MARPSLLTVKPPLGSTAPGAKWRAVIESSAILSPLIVLATILSPVIVSSMMMAPLIGASLSLVTVPSIRTLPLNESGVMLPRVASAASLSDVTLASAKALVDTEPVPYFDSVIELSVNFVAAFTLPSTNF